MFDNSFYLGTHADIMSYFQRIYPGVRGFITVSVSRYCRDRDIHFRSGWSDRQLDVAVAEVVQQVVHSGMQLLRVHNVSVHV